VLIVARNRRSRVIPVKIVVNILSESVARLAPWLGGFCWVSGQAKSSHRNGPRAIPKVFSAVALRELQGYRLGIHIPGTASLPKWI
jgi:hypothetical protein